MRLVIEEHPLVLTPDGYFGIVVADHEVFAANGTQMILGDEEWDALTVLPLNINNPQGPASSFLEMFENRTPAQQGFSDSVSKRTGLASSPSTPAQPA